MVAAPRHSPEHPPGTRRIPNETEATEAGDYALLLIQEWLVASKLESTAQCLADECARLGRPVPPTSSWYRMTEHLGCCPTARGKLSNPLLEVVITKAIAQQEKEVMKARQQPPQQQIVLMSKKMPPKELKFVSTRFLPRSTTASALGNNARERSPPLSSSSSLSIRLRPESAAICKSTSDLISKTLANDAATKTSANANILQRTVKRAIQAQQRPISAASVLTPHHDSLTRRKLETVRSSNNDSDTSPTRSSPGLQGVMEAVATVAVSAAAVKASAHHSGCVPLVSLPQITETSGSATVMIPNDSDDDGEGNGGQKQEQDGDAAQPKLSLEEMSEGRLMEEFGSISRCAIKKLRRVLTKSNACTQEFEKSRRTLDKIKARAKLRQLRRVVAEKQTPLLSSTMDLLTKEPCSLCLHVFPKKNLTMKVSHKSIIDLRASWAVANGPVNTGAAAERRNDDGSSNDEAADPALEEMDHTRLSHLYDEAPICAFCSQLLLNFASYRRRAQQTEGKRMAQEAQKARTASQRRTAARCDPMDFNSYELNSDDDDSDTEEVVEIDQDGRPHVVRRQRQRMVRVPVQLGVVSKRLHYDTLRDDSLIMLNLNEWEKIMN
ncbi:hypothetical protein BBJ28_00018033 [Nothophytophthora sp. Chile5]|nr:hypothetical protein BBJ28_00018033 [Nothophytophthora sp. Chile5]